MACSVTGRPWVVQYGFVGHDHVYIFTHMLMQNFADSLGVGIADMDKLKLPVASKDSL